MDQEKDIVRPKISEEERKRRQEASDFATANVELSGFKFTEEEKEGFKRYINGEVDLQEFIDEGLEEAKKLADELLKNGGTLERPREYFTKFPAKLPPHCLTSNSIEDFE